MVDAVSTALATGAGGIPAFAASITPKNAAYASVGAYQFSSQVKQIVIPNPISGPGVVPAAVDLLFTTATQASSLYTPHTFHSLINQPIILGTGQCSRVTLYFNATFANPVLRSGSVTLYSGACESFPSLAMAVKRLC